jgi:3-hydroxyisobutyrate dehydrogenase
MADAIGFIGLGAIGTPMAAHVARTFDTTVWNRTASRARQFGDKHGCRVADAVSDVVSSADVVITCLPTSQEVDEVVRAAAEAWRAGQLLVDTTSGDPITARATAGGLAAKGVDYVDAPVSGGIAGAEAGTLTVMVGGEESAVRRALPVVECFAGKTVYVGPVGAGHAVKAVNQALLAVSIATAGAGLAALVKLGVSPAKALDVINASTGRSFTTEKHIPERVLTREWPKTFRLALLDKDVGIAAAMLEQAGVRADVIVATKRLLAQARAALGDDADHVELIREIEREAGVEIG